MPSISSGKARPTQIAVIIDVATQFGRGVIAGISRFAHSQPSVSIMLLTMSREQDIEWQLAELSVDAVVARGRETEPWAARMQECGKPVVLVGYEGQNLPVCAALPDYHAIGAMGAEHLLQRGYKHLAIRAIHTDASQRTVEGFAEVGRKHNAKVNVMSLLPTPPATEANIIAMQRDWIANQPKPLGIMATADDAGLKVIQSALSADLVFGRDVAVVGVGNDPILCESSTPMLSSIVFPHEKLGYLAAELANNLALGSSIPTEPISVQPTRVAIRQSTDLAATDDHELIVAINFIREHLGNRIGVQDVADHVGLSRRTLERRFARHLSHTIDREIRRQRVERAKALLVDSDLSIQQIAVMCGFSRPEHLARSFRMIENASPRDYRNEHTLPRR